MEEYTTQQAQLSFKSTGTMTGTGSVYSANPTLNQDGTATLVGSVEPAQAPGASGPKRTSTPGVPSTPGQGSEENQFPVGDVLIPLLIIAIGYAVTLFLRRRKVTSR